jgi:hyaluronoglucosaminidase
MRGTLTFQRRGIVEGFFGPPWSMAHRARIFEFGAERGMNTYLYAPKDDHYHRLYWMKPYPDAEWRELAHLIRLAQKLRIDFVYGFHPGKGLCFTREEPMDALISKATRFYQAGVRTFAILFDDIPSHLENAGDQKQFSGSLARAQALWIKRILEKAPPTWEGVEWWMCPSRYSEDPVLERLFGSFEPGFWETLRRHLPETVACLWTGPRVVSREISLADAADAREQLGHRLILWDNYPVNDLSMSHEMHLGPLTGRDPRLPQEIYGYLNNPLLQETLSFIPLATCFDYAADPPCYDPEKSWDRAIIERFSDTALAHWRTIREFCNRINQSNDQPLPPSFEQRHALQAAHRYLLENRQERWFEEFRPWFAILERTLNGRASE